MKCYPPIYNLISTYVNLNVYQFLFLGLNESIKGRGNLRRYFQFVLVLNKPNQNTVLELFNEKKKSMNSILVQFCEEGSKLNIPFKITPPLINPIVKYSYAF